MRKESCELSACPISSGPAGRYASFTRIPPMVNQIETHVLNQRIEDNEWMWLVLGD